MKPAISDMLRWSPYCMTPRGTLLFRKTVDSGESEAGELHSELPTAHFQLSASYYSVTFTHDSVSADFSTASSTAWHFRPS